MNLITKKKLSELMQKVTHDKTFRLKLESAPIDTLAAEGINLSDSKVVEYIKENILPNGSSLLADGQQSKIFAVATSAGVVVAVSTPAFPKGEELDNTENAERKGKKETQEE
jgi:hypothetical protein